MIGHLSTGGPLSRRYLSLIWSPIHWFIDHLLSEWCHSVGANLQSSPSPIPRLKEEILARSRAWVWHQLSGSMITRKSLGVGSERHWVSLRRRSSPGLTCAASVGRTRHLWDDWCDPNDRQFIHSFETWVQNRFVISVSIFINSEWGMKTNGDLWFSY